MRFPRLQHTKFKVRAMVFNVTFNNISAISWLSVLLVEESGVSREKHRPAASHWQTLSYNFVSSAPAWAGFELTTLVVIGTDCIGSSSLPLITYYKNANNNFTYLFTRTNSYYLIIKILYARAQCITMSERQE